MSVTDFTHYGWAHNRAFQKKNSKTKSLAWTCIVKQNINLINIKSKENHIITNRR